LTVAYIHSNQTTEEKKAAYAADVVYGQTMNLVLITYGDNMALSLEDIVQQGLDYAIVDEADSVLIDEARTPLIISGPVRKTLASIRAGQTGSKNGSRCGL